MKIITQNHSSDKKILSSITNLSDRKRVNVLIIGDTMFERNSSKKVELLSKVYNHVKKSYKYGLNGIL